MSSTKFNPLYCFICDGSASYLPMTIGAIKSLHTQSPSAAIGVVCPPNVTIDQVKNLLSKDIEFPLIYIEGKKHFTNWNPTQHKLDIISFPKEYDPIVWVDSDIIVLKDLTPSTKAFYDSGKPYAFLSDHVNRDPNFLKLWEDGPDRCFVPQACYMLFRREHMKELFDRWEKTWNDWISPKPFANHRDPAPEFEGSTFCIEQYALGQTLNQLTREKVPAGPWYTTAPATNGEYIPPFVQLIDRTELFADPSLLSMISSASPSAASEFSKNPEQQEASLRALNLYLSYLRTQVSPAGELIMTSPLSGQPYWPHMLIWSRLWERIHNGYTGSLSNFSANWAPSSYPYSLRMNASQAEFEESLLSRFPPAANNTVGSSDLTGNGSLPSYVPPRCSSYMTSRPSSFTSFMRSYMTSSGRFPFELLQNSWYLHFGSLRRPTSSYRPTSFRSSAMRRIDVGELITSHRISSALQPLSLESMRTHWLPLSSARDDSKLPSFGRAQTRAVYGSEEFIKYGAYHGYPYPFIALGALHIDPARNTAHTLPPFGTNTHSSTAPAPLPPFAGRAQTTLDVLATQDRQAVFLALRPELDAAGNPRSPTASGDAVMVDLLNNNTVAHMYNANYESTNQFISAYGKPLVDIIQNGKSN